MKTLKIAAGTLLLTLVLWAGMSWPLPRYAFSGIPSSCHNLEAGNRRAMIPGDHLQFLYHLWLATDTFFGPTPLFYNLYEFNTGSDEARYSRSTYYLPFSVPFALTDRLCGHAFAFNFTGIVALWGTVASAFALARGYARNTPVAALAAAVAAMFPYRWFTLLGGSPTGLGMMWIPVLWYGLDIFVRERRARGAALAGAALFFSGWSDSHVFFFAALSAPFWCAVSYAFHRERWLPSTAEIKQWIGAAVPLAIAGVLVLLQARGVKSGLGDTAIAHGARDPGVVALFSPHLSGLFAWRPRGQDAQIYLGYGIAVLLAAAAGAAVFRRARAGEPRAGVLVAGGLVLAAVAGVVVLAAGTNMPGGVSSWLRLVRLVPPYGMIRQSAKIYILMPSLLAAAVAILLPGLLRLLRAERRAALVCGAIGLALLGEYARRIDPTVCLLDHDQPAYAAVAADARAKDLRPHIMALPLWPGDSHWTSVNQYYVSLYRIRMINGYRPTVRRQYFEDVFRRFESFNAGYASDAQLDELLGKGIHYLVLHEDAFPEKVSPFAVSHTIQALLAHPRVRLLRQAGPVWAFEIVDAPAGAAARLPDWPWRFPSRTWQAESGMATNVTVFDCQDASGSRYARFEGRDAGFRTPAFTMAAAPGLCYLVRVRGKADLRAAVTVEGLPECTTDLSLDAADWTWLTVPVPAFEGFHATALALTLRAEGALDADLALLATTAWDPLRFDAPLALPAPCFFHAGYTDLETWEVVLRPGREPADAIFYGPKLPLPKGVYEVELDFTTEAAAGTRLGTLRPRYPNPATPPVEVVAGTPAVLIYTQAANIRLAVDFIYARQAAMRIRNVIVRRHEGG